jgi:UDP-N-acetylmuramate dehydrogenase
MMLFNEICRMQLMENFSLKSYNTFNVACIARYFSCFENEEQLQDSLDMLNMKNLLILGGGSNILFTKNFDGHVLKNECKGIAVVHEDVDFVYVKAGGGENWHQFVQYCVGRGWGGLENLSLIPGNVGAAPIQNIGAYGVEIKDILWSVEAFHLQERKIKTFSNTDCNFKYRDSVFKSKFKNQFAILSVIFQLRKTPVFSTNYGAISQELERMQVQKLSVIAIADAVINIRRSKLPDPAILGSAGSFFKNPIVEIDICQNLKNKFPEIVFFPAGKNKMKLSAGWLIEQCGWKGIRKGDAGCFDKQALVLVNYGAASGIDIMNLSMGIETSVFYKFGIRLEREVNIL